MAQTECRRLPKVLISTDKITHEEWLAYRRKGIGGSDAASVLGISPFRTGVDLCLYGNNEDEVIIRHIDRDRKYEAELIALEENFWVSHIQAKAPPPYVERDGELILDSLRRRLGPSYR